MRGWLALTLTLTLAGCGGDDLYAPCSSADDCSVPDDAEGVCLDKGGDGFCTWECGADDECTFEEEQEEGIDRVCASFEDEAGMYCFPSCDETSEEEDACPAGMTCRSTGGGSDNRKVCFPEG